MKYELPSGTVITLDDKEIARLQETAKISYNEAVYMALDDWAIDHEDRVKKMSPEDKAELISEEREALDKKAKGYRRENAKSEKVRATPTKPRTVHIADEKVLVFTTVKKALEDANIPFTIEKDNKLIHAKVNDKTIKLDFVELGKYKKKKQNIDTWAQGGCALVWTF